MPRDIIVTLAVIYTIVCVFSVLLPFQKDIYNQTFQKLIPWAAAPALVIVPPQYLLATLGLCALSHITHLVLASVGSNTKRGDDGDLPKIDTGSLIEIAMLCLVGYGFIYGYRMTVGWTACVLLVIGLVFIIVALATAAPGAGDEVDSSAGLSDAL